MVVKRLSWSNPLKCLPEIAGAIGGYLIFRHFQPEEPSLLTQENIFDWAKAVYCSLGVFVISEIFLGFPLNSNRKDTKRDRTLVKLLKNGKKEEALEKVKSYIQDDPIPGNRWALLGYLLAEKGDYAGAYDAYKKAVESPVYSRLGTGFWPVDAWIRMKTGTQYFNEIRKARELDSGTIAHYLNEIMLFTFYSFGTDIRKRWDDLYKQFQPKDGARLELKIIEAITTGRRGYKQRSNAAWQEALAGMLGNPEALEYVGESRNPVVRCTSSAFISQTALGKLEEIFDHPTRSELGVEQGNICYFRNHTTIPIADAFPIQERIVGPDGKEYRGMPVKHAGVILEDRLVLDDSRTIDYLTQGVKGLVQFHGRQYKKKESNTFYVERARRIGIQQVIDKYNLDNIFLDDELHDFEKAITKVGELFGNTVHGWYRDANPRNYAVTPFGVVEAFDLQGDRYAPVQIDLVSLLEFGKKYVTEEQKGVLIELYRREYEKENNTKVDPVQFKEAYQAARLQRHLELAGYRARDVRNAKESGKKDRKQIVEKNHEMVIFHLEQAKDAAGQILEDATPITKIVTRLYEQVQRAA